VGNSELEDPQRRHTDMPFNEYLDITGYCGGRTLIPKHNFWLSEMTAMAESDPCVKHALLALSGSYLLDYCPNEGLRTITNQHYSSASKLISECIARPMCYDVGNSDATVAAVVLMEVEDVCVPWGV
jgi:Fungal specific transcription factor domain